MFSVSTWGGCADIVRTLCGRWHSVEIQDLHGQGRVGDGQIDLHPTIGDCRSEGRQLEREHIERVLEDEGGNNTRAAQRLGLDRKTLYRKLEEYARVDGKKKEAAQPK